MRFLILFKMKNKYFRKMKTSLTSYMITLITLFLSLNLILNYENNFLTDIKKKILKKRSAKFLMLISTRTLYSFFFFEIMMILFKKSIFLLKIMILFRIDFAF